MSPSRILLADENETDIHKWKSYLSHQDCEVSVATWDADIFDCVSEWRPHLVVLNPNPPTGNGFDICRQVKQDLATRKTIILMVAWPNDLDDIERAIEAGVDDFISKPIGKCEFVKRVENLVRLSRL